MQTQAMHVTATGNTSSVPTLFRLLTLESRGNNEFSGDIPRRFLRFLPMTVNIRFNFLSNASQILTCTNNFSTELY